jgi:hypothetical protein
MESEKPFFELAKCEELIDINKRLITKQINLSNGE